MIEMTEEEQQEIICDCTGTRKGKILSLIKSGADLDKVSSATGACTGCGSCDVDVINLIDKYGEVDN